MIKINNIRGASVSVNGEDFTGHHITINNGKVIVDGVEKNSNLDGQINVTINGSVEGVEIENGSVTVSGDAHYVKTMSGDVHCSNVLGNVNTMSGDVICETVGGNARQCLEILSRNNYLKTKPAKCAGFVLSSPEDINDIIPTSGLSIRVIIRYGPSLLALLSWYIYAFRDRESKRQQ